MADIVDHAQDAEERHRAQALERLQREIAAGAVLETAANCIDCGSMIPSARQAAIPGVQTCTPCGEARERQARRYGRAA